MSCYYVKGKRKISIQKIMHEFYKETLVITNAEVFSSDELVENTYKKITDLESSSNYVSSNNTGILDFITKENSIFKTIPGLEDQNRLAPEYILEKRVSQWVRDNINSPSTLNLLNSTAEVEELYRKIEPELPEEIKEQPGKIKYLINEILEEIKLEEVNKDFGTAIHELFSLKIRDKESEYNSKLNEIINDDKFSLLFKDAPKEDWKNKINEIIKKIGNDITARGKAISEIFFVYNDSEKDLIALKGKIDLIVVDTNGTAHIFEIKISKNSYKDNKWDQVKTLTLDWQLAIYKQLLGQHVVVKNTELYVIPITIGSPGDPTSLFYEGIFNRNIESKNGLRNGRIETIANRLIPLKIHAEYDPKRVEDFKEKLLRLFGDDYEIKLQLRESSVEEKLKSIEKAQKKHGGPFTFYNNYKEIEGLPYGRIEADTLEELEPKVRLFVNYENNRKDMKVTDLKSAIRESILSKDKINTKNEEYDIQVNRLLLEYLNDNWEVIDEFPETSALGLILLRNRNNGTINVISLSVNQFLANSSIPGMNEGDIEYAKAFLFLNEYKDKLMPYNTNKIGEIVVFNPENRKHYYRTTHTQFKQFYNLMMSKNFKEADIKLTVEQDLLGLVNIALQNLDNFYKSFPNDLAKNKLDNIIRPLVTDNNLTLEKLIQVQKDFYQLYPEYKDKTFEKTLNFEDKTEVLLAMLNVAILSYYKDDLGGDFSNISMFSMNFSDFSSLFKSIYSSENPEYDKEGRKITGIFQGLTWTTPDWAPSKDLRNINKIMSGANSKIAEMLLKTSEKLTKNTLEFYDDINFSETERFLVGETQSKYKNLWLQKGDNVSPEFILKNPYKEDVENALEDSQRKYLKKQLLIINMYKLGIPENEINKLNSDSLDSLLKNDKIAEAIASGDYFRMPLVRREEFSRHKGIFKTAGQTWKERIEPYRHEVLDFLDAKGITAEDRVELEKSRMGFYEMYDTYAAHTPEFKARMVEKHGIDYFEFNLDTIAHRLIFNKIRKDVYDKVFPVVNSYVWWIKLRAGKSNDDISNYLKYISDQIKLSAYGEHIIDPEFKDLTVAQSVFRRFATAAMLGFRPILLAKELVIGTAKGIALAATQIYGKDQFTTEDLLAAYTKMFTIDKKFSQEFNLIDKINAHYRFANMDTNTLALKLQTDRHGMLMRGMSRYMYASNTIPDYQNRLVLFLAKMIHDGSYEAHTNEGGVLRYDPRKDKRFSYYLENRDNHKDSKGNYIPAANDERYNTQRRKYLLLVETLNKESQIFGESFEESDLVPKAYSEQERSSFKSFTDMAYGYYDKDAQQQATNTWWGITWLQFKQFWPGKMKMWFGKPTQEDGSDSAMGTERQVVTEDKNGNKIPMWRKTIQKSDGSYDVIPTTENTGDPLIEWVGTPFEGLAYSVLSFTRDLATLNFDEVKGDKERLARVAFAINDAIFMFLMMSLFVMMFKAFKKESPGGMSKELLRFGEALTKKVANEQNLLDSTFGALSSDPAALSWARRFGADLKDVFEGDKTIRQAASRFGALEFLKEDKD